MNGPGPLGDFLQARRAQLRPEDVGLPAFGPRRVAGLRREELAQLAGVSASYYTRLEQGLSRGASAEVLDAIGRALQLGDHERAHLARLADAARRTTRARRPRPEQVADETWDLLRALDGVPALVLGRRTDVLAWNGLGHGLLAGHLDPLAPQDPARRPNMSRILFLDPHCRELYRDWHRKARAVVGNLRTAVGRHPDDPLLAELIGELTMKSPEFVALWRDHRVSPCDAASYELHHPAVGPLTVTQQTLALVRSPEQVIVVCTTPAGSSSEAALALLRELAGPVSPPPLPAGAVDGPRMVERNRINARPGL
ncbi:helix-turn-helix transcriptional regulator [Streptomyces sp. NPDC046465]|uniref:helix-turn-helix transcriptional regulator n=1 Tax=Streptomyces sp. NPDC046465 TaxID=3155810 RepID=UPI0033C8A083